MTDRTKEAQTTETDAQVIEIYGDLIGPSTDRMVPASFARRLERERDAAVALLRLWSENYADGYIQGHATIVKNTRTFLRSLDRKGA